MGPDDSAYKGGLFELEIKIPEEFPFKSPQIRFITNIYHPNVNKETGEICEDMYVKEWAPVKRIINLIYQ